MIKKLADEALPLKKNLFLSLVNFQPRHFPVKKKKKKGFYNDIVFKETNRYTSDELKILPK